jgi:hypothetical protein
MGVVGNLDQIQRSAKGFRFSDALAISERGEFLIEFVWNCDRYRAPNRGAWPS